MFQVVFRLAQILVLALMLVLPASGVLAQGFMVKPMRMEVSGQAGQNLEIPLQIRNTAGDSVGRVDVRLAGVSQHANGAWKLIEPETAESDDVGLSALPWMSLSENSVEIAPMTPAEISVLVNIPRNARGAYFAALIVETPLPEDEEGFNVRVRFLVPVIIRIEGRPVRQDVGIAAADLVFQDGSAGGPRTTLAEMWATNEGRTYSRVSGSIALDLEVEGRWRPVTRFDTVERSIIPGASINLGKDIERRLPLRILPAAGRALRGRPPGGAARAGLRLRRRRGRGFYRLRHGAAASARGPGDRGRPGRDPHHDPLDREREHRSGRDRHRPPDAGVPSRCHPGRDDGCRIRRHRLGRGAPVDVPPAA